MTWAVAGSNCHSEEDVLRHYNIHKTQVAVTDEEDKQMEASYKAIKQLVPIVEKPFSFSVSGEGETKNYMSIAIHTLTKEG